MLLDLPLWLSCSKRQILIPLLVTSLPKAILLNDLAGEISEVLARKVIDCRATINATVVFVSITAPLAMGPRKPGFALNQFHGSPDRCIGNLIDVHAITSSSARRAQAFNADIYEPWHEDTTALFNDSRIPSCGFFYVG
jgi:hypothetical protein